MSLGQVAAWNQIWRNFCVSDAYEPGSTQKIFTVAGALEEGVISPTDTFLCEGNLQFSGKRTYLEDKLCQQEWSWSSGCDRRHHQFLQRGHDGDSSG